MNNKSQPTLFCRCGILQNILLHIIIWANINISGKKLILSF